MPITGPDRLGLHALPIATRRLRLRLPADADAPAIEEYVSDAAVALPTAGIPHPYPKGAAADWIARAEAEARTGGGLDLVIERAADGVLVGAVAIRQGEGATAEIGYWIGQPFWRRGYATEAVSAIVAHGFARMGLRAIEASAGAENTASIRVQEKAGLALHRSEHRHRPARGIARTDPIRRITLDAWQAAHPAPTLLVAAVALLDADDRVLIAQRPEGKAMAGLWEFPGGKVADGETPEAALIRELDEELGIDTSESCLAPFTFASHRYETFHLLMPLYVCRVWRGQVAPREGQTLKWVRPMRLADYPMPPADVPLIAMLRDFL